MFDIFQTISVFTGENFMPPWSLFNQLTGAEKIRAGLCVFQLKNLSRTFSQYT
jgi:hypothetical protein